eukprot:TRINITY_DN9914_c0_g1_i1.p1 TRINITY_DN9914_c0_g1~~TRINITY_DN9914_c0_g1_i1.p1  ORF type:complete len:228 (+),score=38.59 TRINITY_DN9914_c0_g1_i1:32-715(+)
MADVELTARVKELEHANDVLQLQHKNMQLQHENMQLRHASAISTLRSENEQLQATHADEISKLQEQHVNEIAQLQQALQVATLRQAATEIPEASKNEYVLAAAAYGFVLAIYGYHQFNESHFLNAIALDLWKLMLAAGWVWYCRGVRRSCNTPRPAKHLCLLVVFALAGMYWWSSAPPKPVCLPKRAQAGTRAANAAQACRLRRTLRPYGAKPVQARARSPVVPVRR